MSRRLSVRIPLLGALVVVAILTLCTASAVQAEDVRIFGVLAQSILDDANPLRYSPMRAVDSDQSTVFAFHRTAVDPSKPFLTVLFADAVTLSKLRIEPGYFDSRWFAKNDRLTGVKIVTKDRTKGPTTELHATLQDKMEPQDIAFSVSVECTELELYIDSFAKGSSWDDICISDIAFFRNDVELAPTIGVKGNATFNSTSIDYSYDGNSRLAEKHAQYGKAGDEYEYYTYNPEGVLLVALNRAMGDYLNDVYTCYFYDAKEPKLLVKTVMLNREGRIVEEQQYGYDKQKMLISIHISGGRNGQILFKYKGSLQTEKETSITNSDQSRTYEKIVYFYEKDVPSGELVTRDKTSVLFQDILDEGRVLRKLPVTDTDTNWSSEDYTYVNGRLTNDMYYDHQRTWGYFGN